MARRGFQAKGHDRRKGDKVHSLKYLSWSSCHGLAEMNLTRNHEVSGLIPGLTQWVKDLELLRAVV